MSTPIINPPIVPLACPFCGDHPVWRLYQPDRPWFLIGCDCKVSPMVGDITEWSAIEAWNKREEAA